MTKGEPLSEDVITSLLDNVLTRTVDWVKYAEAKNAVLLTLTGASIGALAGWVAAHDGPPDWLRISAAISLGLMIVSVLISLSSFLPILDFDLLRLKRRHGKVD